jgi:putative serine protease PepD
VEQPPTPSSPGSEPDLPKPPIWERSVSSEAPPIQIPQVNAPAAPAQPAPQPQPQSTTPPIVPDVTQSLPAVAPRLGAQPPAAPRPAAPPRPAAFASPSATSFSDRSFMTAPSSGAGTTESPQWPTEPPTVGRQISPTSPKATKPRRRVGLIALAVFVAAAVAAGGFFFGRSVASSESAMTPIAAPSIEAPTIEAPTTVPVPTSQPTTEVPTPAPSLPPANDAPLPILPGEGAEEPVAAVARAVAPAVVLIQNELGQGSGIIYDQSGLILTNAHVVGQFTEVQVTLASGVRVPGQVLGADQLTDVAVISIDTDFEFGVSILAPESSIEVGQLAVAIGSPFGLAQTVTSGIVSAKGRVLENQTEDGRLSVVAMIQTDASINPGNSGGALADREGRVIGMNTSIRTDGSGGNIGVGFAVPAETAKLIADRIIAGEPLEQGFLGVNGGTPVIGEPGVVVSEVTVGSGADSAGLQSGDLIVGFNGTAIKGMSDLAAAVRLQPPNATVTVEFVRDGQPQAVEVTLGLLNEQ